VTTPSLPLTIGPAGTFARVVDHLRARGYDELTVSKALGIPSIFAFGSVRPETLTLPTAADDPLAFLIRTFLLVERISGDAVRAQLDVPVRAAFEQLGLLRPDATGDSFTAPVLLYPVSEFWIASDVHHNPDDSPYTPPPDAVFPAIFPGNLRFLRLLPQGTYEAALDLGGGTGIGALVLSRRVRHAVSADITARATHFAQFNRMLNACANLEIARGDLYDAVPGRTFDCIVTHPPYMPSPDDTWIFRDGGPTGERLAQRIIADLPAALRPGGIFCAVCAAWDTDEAPLEDRVRGWLGERADEFELLLGVETEMAPAELARMLAKPEHGPGRGTVAEWETRFREWKLERHVYGALVLARRDGPGDPVTLRTWLGTSTTGADLEREIAALRWRAARRAAGTLSSILDALQPRLADALEVHVTYVKGESGLAPSEAILATSEPFRSRTRIEPWMLSLLSAIDGDRTPAAIHADLHAKGVLPDGFSPADLRTFVELMLERGYLETIAPPTP